MENPIKNIYQRIIEVMREVDYIQKGDKKVANQYRYVSHDQVSEAIHPKLVKHGLVIIPTVKEMRQEENRTVICLKVAFINADNPDDYFNIESWGYGIDTGDKGPGKAYSYAYKYALLKTFCLETGDDPDHEQDAKFEPKKTISQEKLASIIPYDVPEMMNYKNYVLKTFKIKDYSEIPDEAFDNIFNQMKNVYSKIKGEKK